MEMRSNVGILKGENQFVRSMFTHRTQGTYFERNLKKVFS